MIKLIPMQTIVDRYHIYYNGESVGVIELSVGEDYVEIKYIKIHKEQRRKKLATKVIELLKEENKDKEIFGDSLPKAIPFWDSIGVEFYDPFDNDGIILTPFKLI